MKELLPSAENLARLSDAEIDAIPIDKLLDILQSIPGYVVGLLYAGAKIVASIDRRGGDLSDLEPAMVTWWREIAAGRYLPELLVKYIGAPDAKIGLLRKLSLDEQKMLNDGHVKLFIFDGKGGVDHKIADPLSMSPAELRQVFAAKGVNSEAEQLRIWKGQQAERNGRDQRYRIHVNHDDGIISVAGIRIPVADMVSAMASRASEPNDDELDKPVSVRLSQREHERLRMRAAKVDITPAEAARRALKATAMI